MNRIPKIAGAQNKKLFCRFRGYHVAPSESSDALRPRIPETICLICDKTLWATRYDSVKKMFCTLEDNQMMPIKVVPYEDKGLL